MAKDNLILDKDQILQKIKRIAYEIYERNLHEEGIIIAGVEDMGYVLAKMIVKDLDAISPLKTTLVSLSVDKAANTQSEVKLDSTAAIFGGKCVVLVDDVLNSGKTLAYCIKPFLEAGVKKLETAVLVNRSHKLFPISADYNGYELSTTLNEHVDVRLDPENMGVYLF